MVVLNSIARIGKNWALSGWLVLFETIIQCFVLSIIIFGLYLSIFHIGAGWLIHRQKSYILGTIYLLSVSILGASEAALYIYLCVGRHTRNVATFTLPDKSLLTETYICSSNTGDLDVCNRGKCNGKWKPPRTHHCSTCGVCRLEFDHHCPWVGNCVTLSNLKAFCSLLVLLPVAIVVMVLPVHKLLLAHITLALGKSRGSEWANRIWWDWPGSWILCAGPFGRWIVGTILGFLVLKQDRQEDTGYLPKAGYLLGEPHLRLILPVGILVSLSMFTLFLAISCTKMILQGVTTLETLRRPPIFVCMPGNSAEHTIVTPVLSDERPYDLGLACNWKSFIRSPLIPKPSVQAYVWPKLSSPMLQRIWSSFQPRN